MNFFNAFGKSARTINGLFIVIGSFTYLFSLLFVNIPNENKDIVYLTAGLVLGALANVTNYYFGSSKDKSDQEKATIIKDQNTTP